MFRPLLLITLLLVVTSCANAGSADYLLRLIVDDKGTPPSALQMPFKSAVKGPKKGLGPVLHKIATTDPVFREGYYDFLTYLDDLNNRLAEAGGGTFRMQAIMRGAEDFAKAIELMGGSANCEVKANDLGVSWDTMMSQARVFADRSLRNSEHDLSDEEHTFLSNLFALGYIAGASNRVLPDDYIEAWKEKHPEYTEASDEPQGGIKKIIWQGVKEQVIWMYHAGSMPWLDPDSKDPHDYYDTFHFFSHGWMCHFNLYRKKYFKKGLFSKGFAESKLKWSHLRKQFWYSDFIGFGYEVMTVAMSSGFVDVTPTDELPGGLKEVAQFLHIGGLPIVEAIRDTQINRDGAEYGATLAVTFDAVAPSERKLHQQLLTQFKKGK